MMFHRLGLINKNQRGFTLLELLIAVTITGLVTGAITMTLFQVFTGNVRSSNHMTAVRQVQEAGYWVSRDAQMAQSVELGATAGFPLTLTRTDWDSGDLHQVIYTLLVDNKLQRRHTCAALGLDETSIMAQFIDADETSCEFTSGELIFTVTAKLGIGSQEASETRVYKVVPKPML